MPVYNSPLDYILSQGPADLDNSIMFGQKSEFSRFRNRRLPYPSVKDFEAAGGSWNTTVQPISSLVPTFQFWYPAVDENDEGQQFIFGNTINLSGPIYTSSKAEGVVLGSYPRSKMERALLELYATAVAQDYTAVWKSLQSRQNPESALNSFSFFDNFKPMSRFLSCVAIVKGRVQPWAFKVTTVDPSGANYRKKENADIENENGMFQQMSFRQFIKDGILVNPPHLTSFQITAAKSKHLGQTGNPYLAFTATALPNPAAFAAGLNTAFVPIKDKESGIFHYPFLVYPDNDDINALLKYIRDMRDASPEERAKITPPQIRRYPDENGQIVFVSHVPYYPQDDTLVGKGKNSPEPVVVDLTQFEAFSEKVLADMRNNVIPTDYMPETDFTLLGGYYVMEEGRQVEISEAEISARLKSRDAENGKIFIDNGTPEGQEVFYAQGELWRQPFYLDAADAKGKSIFTDKDEIVEKARELGIPCVGDEAPVPFAFLDEPKPAKVKGSSKSKAPAKPAQQDPESEGQFVEDKTPAKPSFKFKVAK